MTTDQLVLQHPVVSVADDHLALALGVHCAGLVRSGPDEDSSGTAVLARARQRRQCSIASQLARGRILKPHRGHVSDQQAPGGCWSAVLDTAKTLGIDFGATIRGFPRSGLG